MWTTQAAVVLLFLVMVPVPGEGVEFPGLLGEISDCVKAQCSEKIKACEKLHGTSKSFSISTPQLKACVAKSCKETMIGCMDWIPKALGAAGLSQSSLLTPEFIKIIADTTIKIVVDSYLDCFRANDLQNSTLLLECLLGNMLDRGEPYIKLALGTIFFSDTDLLMCYLRKCLTSMVNCMNDLDKDYMSQLEENMNWESTFNRNEYVTCLASSYRGKKCYQMISRIYGSTPLLQTQSKGLFVCMLNAVVVSTAAC